MKATKKQTKKPAGKSRKSTKPAAPARAASSPRRGERDPRIPAAGTILTRVYKGREHRLKVLADGFEYEGETFRSLTAAALRATGYAHISGTDWWGVSKRPAATPKTAAPKTLKTKRMPSAPTETAPANTATPDGASA